MDFGSSVGNIGRIVGLAAVRLGEIGLMFGTLVRRLEPAGLIAGHTGQTSEDSDWIPAAAGLIVEHFDCLLIQGFGKMLIV